jgi:CheY-like chemotaxis protein
MQSESAASGGPVVMLVEDFQDTREMMRRMLELQGCRVVEAVNGQEAIEI